MEAIKTVELTKVYRDTAAVKGLNLSVAPGELFALLGVNGAGKTTTIKMLCGLCRPTSGDAFLNGHSAIREKALVKRLIGVSPQETAIAPGLSVWENLWMMGGIQGLPAARRRQRIDELTAQFELEHVLKRRAGHLSGGWQRRLSLAMALVGGPEILFLDEPTLGLDVLARAELWEIIRTLRGKMTIVLTTHYMEEAEALSDHLAVMKDGAMIFNGTAALLKAQTGAQRLEEAFVSLVKGERS